LRPSARATHALLNGLVTTTPPRNHEIEAAEHYR
jgi:hypothetical protein